MQAGPGSPGAASPGSPVDVESEVMHVDDQAADPDHVSVGNTMDDGAAESVEPSSELENDYEGTDGIEIATAPQIPQYSPNLFSPVHS